MENRISEARREYASMVGKFTQEDAARYFKVSLSTYQKWEQGKGMMNGSQLRELSKKYGKSVDYLLMIDGAEKHGESRGSAQKLTPDEQRLLDAYRKMEPERRQLVLALMDYRGEAK